MPEGTSPEQREVALSDFYGRWGWLGASGEWVRGIRLEEVDVENGMKEAELVCEF